MHRQICDLSRENVSYGICSNGWKHGKWTNLRTGSQRGGEKNPAEANKKKQKTASEASR